jgi:hypothetical protein
MPENITLMLGTARLDLPLLRAIAGEFGWVVNEARNLREASSPGLQGGTAAVLFHRDALGHDHSWLDAVRLIRTALPDVRLIACYGFSESINWPELSEAGVYHSLWLPLKENEVRQSLGFIAQAEERDSRATSAEAVAADARPAGSASFSTAPSRVRRQLA